VRVVTRADEDLDLSSAEGGFVLAEALATRDALRNSILNDLAARIQQGSWINSIVAPVAGKPSSRLVRCPRCNSTAMLARYDPFEERCLAMVRYECDRCGTLGDRFGDGPLEPALDARMLPAAIKLLHPRLHAGASGLVLVHRHPGVAARQWPDDSWSTFSRSEIGTAGRITFVALMAGPDYLQASYVTTFLDPGNDGQPDRAA
jgi:transposase-like protein